MKATAIWQMRFWDKKVLVNHLDVHDGTCYLYFCCDRNYPDLYSYNGTQVKQDCGLCSNGKIICYEIPASMLSNAGPLPDEFKDTRDKEYKKYLTKKKKEKNDDIKKD